jgi:hypothetical protein
VDSIQRDFRLGLKLSLFGHFRLFPPRGILAHSLGGYKTRHSGILKCRS